TSEAFLGQHSLLDAYAGTFVYPIMEATREGQEVIKFARDTIVEADDTLTLFARPVLGNKASEDVIDMPGAYRERFGDLTSERLEQVSRSEEHTSELQSRENLVCRLLLEKKNKK